MVMDREAWCATSMGSQTVGHDWATKLNSDFHVHRISSVMTVKFAGILLSTYKQGVF